MDNGPEWHELRARFAGTCAECGGRIVMHQQCLYSRHVRKIKHLPGQCSPMMLERRQQAAALMERFKAAPKPAPKQLEAPKPPALPPQPPAAAVAATPKAEAQTLRAMFPTYGALGEFATASDFCAEIDQLAADRRAAGKTGIEKHWLEREDLEWYGIDKAQDNIETGHGVYRLIRNGWPRGATRIAEAFSRIESTLHSRSRKRVRVRAAQGAEVDVTQYWRGRGDIAWTDARREQRTGPIRYTITVDAIELGGNDAERMFWRGAAVCALSDLLSKAGYAVRIQSAWHSDSKGGVACRVTLKDFSAPMDIEALAACAALPAFFRLTGHWWGNMRDADAHRDQSHGYPVRNWPNDGTIVAKQYPPKGIWNEATAVEWVEQHLAAIGLSEQQAA